MAEHRSPGARLDVVGLTKSYYGTPVLREVGFSVAPGEIVGLIGPNGSGKTTAIDCASGVTRADSVQVLLDGRDVSGQRSDRLARHGLVRTFQQVRVFGSLSVRDNIGMGWYVAGRAGSDRLRWRDVPSRVDELVELFNLTRLAGTPADRLSYGQRKLVELAAALLCRPRIILLDEPVAAINPTLGAAIRGRIAELNGTGVSVLLVEHNLELVTGICQRLVVLDHGEKIAEGSPADVLALPQVQEAYFGR